MSSFRLLVNCLANTTRKYFMSTSELYSMRQQAANQEPSCPSASYTLTAGSVWRLQWAHQQPSRCGHDTRYLDTYLGWLWVPPGPALAWSLVVATQEMDAAAAAEVVKWSLSARHSGHVPTQSPLAGCGLQSFQELNQTHKEETIKQTGFDKQRLWLVLLILTTCN